MLTTIRYILLTALRDRLFIGLFAVVIAATLISLLLGSTAFLESAQMTLALTAGASRLIVLIGLIVFACFHIRQMFDSKEMEMMLSRPISRHMLLMAYWLGFAAVGMVLCLPVFGILALMGHAGWLGLAAWSASLLLEVMLVLALALFAALTLRSAALSVMGCMGCYVLARMMAFFVMTSQSGLAGGAHMTWAKYLLELISIMVPRLDMFTQSQWLVYGGEALAGWWHVPVQAAIFIPLLLLASVADFSRREL